MKTDKQKQFDKWLMKSIGVQDADIFQKGTLVREVAINYASDREAKYKELWGAMKEAIRQLNVLIPDSDKVDELLQKISSLEQELGLNEE
jgi:hypothetical protein